MIMPGVQKPHWKAELSANAFWSGLKHTGSDRVTVKNHRAASAGASFAAALGGGKAESVAQCVQKCLGRRNAAFIIGNDKTAQFSVDRDTDSLNCFTHKKSILLYLSSF